MIDHQDEEELLALVEDQNSDETLTFIMSSWSVAVYFNNLYLLSSVVSMQMKWLISRTILRVLIV